MAAGGSFWEGLHRCLAARDAIDNEFLRGLRHGSAFMVALASGGREPLLTPIRVMVGEQGAHAPIAVNLRNKSYPMNDLRSERGGQRDGKP
jgi:hypothetical protein